MLQVGEGSLYPALQRLLLNGWVKAEWVQRATTTGAPGSYTLTAAGKKHLALERKEFDQLVSAIQQVLDA